MLRSWYGSVRIDNYVHEIGYVNVSDFVLISCSILCLFNQVMHAYIKHPHQRTYKLVDTTSNTQTWFYEANKQAVIGNRKYWIYYKKGIVMVKYGIKKAEFRFKTDENQVWIQYHHHIKQHLNLPI
jgi:hypothetical protein